MSMINYASREINCKLVYYGPGLGGKTTNLEYIYRKFHQRIKSEMVTVKTHGDRTLFFDFLPLNRQNSCGFLVNSSYICCPEAQKRG